jgi:hypothetical protein
MSFSFLPFFILADGSLYQGSAAILEGRQWRAVDRGDRSPAQPS